MRYTIWKSILTVAFAMMFMVPVAANAQSEVCNAYVDISGYDGPDVVFEGDTVTLHSQIGAGVITDNTLAINPYIDITGVAFGMDCGGGPMSELADCTAEGHQVEYLGVSDTNCVTPTGAAAFIVPESNNIVAIPVVGGDVVRMNYSSGMVGQTCDLDLDFKVTEMTQGGDLLQLALGLPYENMQGTCSNGLNASAYAKASLPVHSCGISVVKEVSLDGEDWYDAKTEEAALLVGDAEVLYYRVRIINDGSAPLVGDVWVTDSELGIDEGFDPGDDLIVELGEFNIASKCAELYREGNSLFTNEASVEGFCRLEGGGFSAVSDTASDIANVLCPTPEPEIDVQKEIFDGEEWVEVHGPVDAPSGALYRITVRNVGGIDLENVVIEDSMISDTPYEISDLAMGETVVVEASSGDADMIWTALDVDEVCAEDEVGSFENWVTATGYSVFDGEETTDSDNATLECRGVPKISLMKEVSLDGGQTWFDAEIPETDLDDPLPSAMVGEGDDAMYRLTVGNIGTATLYNVVVDDEILGLDDFLVGTMEPMDIVVLAHGQLFGNTTMDLDWPDICDSRGYKTNVAYASGADEYQREDTDSDAATVDCIGEPAIQVVKEVSVDGQNWSTVVDANAPANAYYRITVTNIGTIDLEDVVIDDELLGITDYPVKFGEADEGELASGESYVIESGELEAIDGYVAQSCDTTETIDNTVLTEGFYLDEVLTRVFDEADAQLNCEDEYVFWCDENGGNDKPNNIWFKYTGDPDNNHQPVSIATPDPLNPLPASIFVEVYNDSSIPPNPAKWVAEFTVFLGGEFMLDPDWANGNSGKVQPNTVFRIYDEDGGTLLQSVFLHTSCSAPLWIGDQFGVMKIVDINRPTVLSLTKEELADKGKKDKGGK